MRIAKLPSLDKARASTPHQSARQDSSADGAGKHAAPSRQQTQKHVTKEAGSKALASPRRNKLKRENATSPVSVIKVAIPSARLLANQAQEKIHHGDPAAARKLLSLASLCTLSPAVITVGYENDLGYCDHFFKDNLAHLNSGKFIVVLDGLPGNAQGYGFQGCKLPPGFKNLDRLQLVALTASKSSQHYLELQFLSDLLDTLSKSRAACKKELEMGPDSQRQAQLRQQIAGIKSTTRRLMTDIGLALNLHAAENTFTRDADRNVLDQLLKKASDGKNVKSSVFPDISAGLNRLAFSYMQRNKDEDMREQSSGTLHAARAGQIALLSKEHPDKTIIVRVGAALLHGTQEVLKDASGGEAFGTTRPGLLEKLSLSLEQQGSGNVLPLVMTRNQAKGNEQVRHGSIRMSLGEAKVRTTDDCVAIDYTLFRSSSPAQGKGQGQTSI